jgi:hypothetical protein
LLQNHFGSILGQSGDESCSHVHYFRDRRSLNEIEELHEQRLAHLPDQLRARPVEGALES